MLDDTIAAIATPIGEGEETAVIRISGNTKRWRLPIPFFQPVRKTCSAKPSAAASHTIQKDLVTLFATEKQLMKSSSPLCARRALVTRARTLWKLPATAASIPAKLVTRRCTRG